MADFVQVLKENLDRNGPRITIVLDDAHRLAEQKDDRFLPTLLKIGELTKRNIHVVTISCESIQTFQTSVDLVKPQTIFFGAYTKKELIEVLLKEAPRDIAKERYRAFLDPMVAAFYDTCRAPRELRTALEPLWKRYSEKLYEAIRNGTPENELPEPRRLYANLMSAKKNREPTGPSQEQNYAQKQQQQQQQAKIHAGLTVPLSKANLALQRGEWPVPEERYFTGEAVLEDATGDAANTTNTSYIAKALDFDIPKLTKFLLLSAYIVSKNDESVDNRLFATEGAVGNHRKRGRLAHDRNVDRAVPSLLGRHQRLQTGTPPLRLPTHRPPIVRGRWFRSRGFGRRALIRGRLHANIQRDLVRFARVESRRRHAEIPVPSPTS